MTDCAGNIVGDQLTSPCESSDLLGYWSSVLNVKGGTYKSRNVNTMIRYVWSRSWISEITGN